MKKLFRFRSENKENWENLSNEEIDWDYDGQSDAGEAEEYYEESEEPAEEYYEESEEPAEEEYYEASGEPVEEEYYEASEEPAEEEYYEASEEPAEEEYYETEEGAGGEYYEPEADGGEGIYYEADGTEYLEAVDEDEEEGEEKRGLKGMDLLMMIGAAAVLILAVITGGIYIGAQTVEKQITAMASVGAELENIEIIGDKGITAAADARLSELEETRRLAEQDGAEQDQKEDGKHYNETDNKKVVSVSMEAVSVLKDLKLKFSNVSSGKLVSNVPFSVQITMPDGKTEVWTDDDMDGVIYKKNLTAGNYQVEVTQLTSEKYSGYTTPAGSKTVEVKKDIEYKQINVTNEIKKETEVNAAKEDTNTANANQVESALTDTVAWVESTVIATSYREIARSEIKEPAVILSSLRQMWNFATQNSGDPDSTSGGDSGSTDTTSGGDSGNGDDTTSGGDNGSTDMTSGGDSGSADTTSGGDSGSADTPTASGGDATTSGGDASVIKPKLTTESTEVTVLTEEKKTLTVTLVGKAIAVPTVKSADESIATVVLEEDKASIQGTDGSYTTTCRVTITGQKSGKVTITLTHPEDAAVTAECAVTVALNPKSDKTTKLVDKSGNQLYIQKDNAYVEAVYADYYTAEHFYVRNAAKYTGWQTIDGNVYFFDVNGNKVTGEQVIQGAKYNFASDGSLMVGSGTMGIDVSKWNGTIDWNAVKNSGISYVIIRCGYRGKDQGSLIQDSTFVSNIQGATNAGLKVGIYFFSQAVDEVEAVEEASMVLELIKGYRISYPVFIDVEQSGGRGDNLSKQTLTAVCKTFCETIRNGGYTAGVYSNKYWFTEKINMSELSAYKIWLAQYAATPTYTGRYDMWQYKSTGRVSGISGDVDMNISYLGY